MANLSKYSFISILFTSGCIVIFCSMMYANMTDEPAGKEALFNKENNILTITTLCFVMFAVIDSMPLFNFVARSFSYRALLKKIAPTKRSLRCDDELTVYVNVTGTHMRIDRDSEQAVLLHFHKSFKNWHDNDRVLIKFTGIGVMMVVVLQILVIATVYSMHCCEIEKIDIIWLLGCARFALSLIIFLEVRAEVNLPSYKRVRMLYKGTKPGPKRVTTRL